MKGYSIAKKLWAIKNTYRSRVSKLFRIKHLVLLEVINQECVITIPDVG